MSFYCQVSDTGSQWAEPLVLWLPLAKWMILKLSFELSVSCVCFYWFLCCVLCPMLLVPPVCPLLIASSILSSVYIFHGNVYLQNLRSPVQKSKFSVYLSFFLYKYKNNRSSKNKSIEQGFQSGPVPGTFTRLRSCIVLAEITEPPKISGCQNHKYDRLVEYFS